MATNIDPFKKKTQPIPQPVNTKAQEELLRQVTGVTLPEGFPLPEGMVSAATIPGNVRPGANLTEFEKTALKNFVGWTEESGQALPATPEGRKALHAAIAAARDKPINLDTTRPPLQVTTVDIETLPPEKQAQLQATMQAIVMGENARAAQVNAATRSPVKGGAAVDAAATQAVTAFKTAQAAKAGVPQSVIVPPVPAFPAQEQTYHVPKPASVPAPQPTPVPVAQPTPVPQPIPKPAATPQSVPSETGAANVTLTTCPHCAWDLSLPDTVEPSHETKLEFLGCLLGDKPFTQDYPLFNGEVLVTLRTVTTRELDTIYQQTHTELLDGKIKTQDDFLETINRYRLMLQIRKITSPSTMAMNVDLPDGYSKSKNGYASGFWVTEDREAEFSPTETGLPAIEEYMMTNVLKSETLFRVTSVACRQFNRLVAKLEGMADNSDFWKPTAQPY